MFTTINQIYSPESISFQNDAFFKSMTAIIDEFRKDKAGKNITEFEIAVAKCIKDYTNINVDINVGDYEMMTEPPSIDKNNPLLEGYGWKGGNLSKEALADIRKSKDAQVRSLIDANGSYVHGYFAELDPVRMMLNAPMIYGNNGLLYKLFDGRTYTSPELAAIVLHEVGHLWSFFEMMVRFRTTNQVMSSMFRELEGTEDHGKREIIIKEATDMLQLDNVDAMSLSTKNNTTIYTVVISSIARTNTSQSGAMGYDINSFEALSDQFAARHGAGRALVTGLDKVYKGSIYRRGWVSYFFFEYVKVSLIAVGLFEIGTGSILGGYSTLVVALSLIMADSHHEWYDKPGARFKRIRNQLVEELKNQNLPKDDSIRIRSDIEAIDEINDKYKDHTQFIGLFYDYLTVSGANKRKQIEFQQSLEELASNKLFYFANQLKHI